MFVTQRQSARNSAAAVEDVRRRAIALDLGAPLLIRVNPRARRLLLQGRCGRPCGRAGAAARRLRPRADCVFCGRSGSGLRPGSRRCRAPCRLLKARSCRCSGRRTASGGRATRRRRRSRSRRRRDPGPRRPRSSQPAGARLSDRRGAPGDDAPGAPARGADRPADRPGYRARHDEPLGQLLGDRVSFVQLAARSWRRKASSIMSWRTRWRISRR